MPSPRWSPRASIARRRRRTPWPPDAAEVQARTADGVTLRGVRLPGAPGPTFVVVHGMTHSVTTPGTARVIATLAEFGSVVALDLRGHGRSDGYSSVGDTETLDVDAAIALARQDDRPVAVVGFSLGAAVALRQAAFSSDQPDVVVSVSSPARWFFRGSTAMRRVNWLLEHPAGPLVGRWMGIRLGPSWDAAPPSPVMAVGRITVPLLLVHGTADHYFPLAHALDLQRASAGRAELWTETGMGHAENATDVDLTRRIGRWVLHAIGE